MRHVRGSSTLLQLKQHSFYWFCDHNISVMEYFKHSCCRLAYAHAQCVNGISFLSGYINSRHPNDLNLFSLCKNIIEQYFKTKAKLLLLEHSSYFGLRNVLLAYHFVWWYLLHATQMQFNSALKQSLSCCSKIIIQRVVFTWDMTS